MILVDTSVWVDHLRAVDDKLVELLESGQVLCHPFVIGEIALGSLRQRDAVLEALQELPQATMASDEEVLHLIDREVLVGQGIGYIDAHLIAAVRLTTGASLWTCDKRLHRVATKLALTPHRPR